MPFKFAQAASCGIFRGLAGQCCQNRLPVGFFALICQRLVARQSKVRVVCQFHHDEVSQHCIGIIINCNEILTVSPAFGHRINRALSVEGKPGSAHEIS